MKTKQDVKAVWDEMELHCHYSITPEYANEFLKKLELDFPKKLIYSKNRYREQSNGKPRVDCEDLLVYAFEMLDLEPDKVKLEKSNIFMGEGSRRTAVEKAYLE